MKKHLINNTVLSLSFLFLLVVFDNFSKHEVPAQYYFTILYFFSIYLTQAALVFRAGSTQSAFVIIYNVTSILKMFISLLILVAYYLAFEQEIDSFKKIRFSAYFLVLYFIYLIVSTKTLFYKSK